MLIRLVLYKTLIFDCSVLTLVLCKIVSRVIKYCVLCLMCSGNSIIILIYFCYYFIESLQRVERSV